MRRQRTVVVNPEECSTSPLHGSPRHAVSPKSIGSESSFQTGLSVGYVESVVGHDDPTLVHTNVKENPSSRNDDHIRNIHSEALGSFLTASYSEEERDSPEDARELGQSLDDEKLRQQLVELDRTQDAWRAKRQEVSDDVDETEDFYVKEAGEFTPSSSRKRYQLAMKEATIYEEVEERQETIYEEDEMNEGPHPEEERTVEESSRFESHIGMLTPKSDTYADDPESHVQTETIERAPKPMSSPKIQQHDPQEGADRILLDVSRQQHQTKDNTENTSYDECPPQNPPEQGSTSSSLGDYSTQYRMQELIGTSSNQERISKKEMKQQQNSIPLYEGGKVDSSSAASGSRTAAASKSLVQCETSDLDFEYPSMDDELDDRKNDVSSHLGFDVAKTHDQEKARDFVDIEDNIVVPCTVKNDDCNYNDKIIRAVQERLTDQSVAPYAMDQIEPNSKPGLFKPKIGYSSPMKSIISMWRKPEALASQVDQSNDEYDAEANMTSNPRKRRWKLCIVNVCLGAVIIVAIICAVLLGIEIAARNKGSSSVKRDETQETASPTVSPIESRLEDRPKVSPVESRSENSPTASPVESRSEISPSATDAPVQLPESPIQYSSAIEEEILMISGDSIYNMSTPQYAAYDWLLTKDPANLDLGSSIELESQRFIAALFYFAMNGNDWIDQYGFLDESHVCDWNNGPSSDPVGIACDSLDKITGFVINENNLRGQLPRELQELTDITILQLRANDIYGTLPSELGKLSLLEEIDLRQNELVGTIPESIFNLPEIKRILLLRNSQLGGTIPASIEKASNLEMISIQRCDVTGSLPSTIGSLSRLFFLTFLHNSLTGTIPDSLVNLSKLEVLELSENKLTGHIPPLSGQDSLYYISLYDNKLTGSIPTTLGDLPTLMFLDIRDNRLNGTIPHGIGLNRNLVTFFAENNQLTGTLPSFSSNAGLLQAVNLSRNKLSGDLNNIFGQGGSVARLVNINLAHNSFVGSISPSIGRMNSLSELNLRGNSISGTIPTEVGLLRELDTLILQDNDLTGTLPEELGLVEQLVYLNIASNQFEGTIPDTLVLLSRLTVLDLQSNDLMGSIPTIFGQLSNLDELYLHSNNLVGDLSGTFCKRHDPDSTFRFVGVFTSDCLQPNPAVQCSCCTVCCQDDECFNMPKLPSK
ncbi:unnamed protein product [Pseudo-nitzschia multistriata]|uniref:L domain-like protein n=1 Tax=Pseudo-nitzschia multistriata TaxID=183589 RepID=A0A448Z297_9STRA|nr:unnamed protein product [Pseudo-nitzschia multistriata]